LDLPKEHKLNNKLHKGVTICGQGPAIVLLHSSLSSSNQWQNLVNKLKNNFTCINFDLLGYGAAEQVVDKENFSFMVEVKRIYKVLAQVIPDRKYHLVGHSCGGAIALKMAVESPDNLLSLSLFEPVAFHLLADKQVFNFADEIAVLDDKQATETFVDYWNGAGYFRSLPEKLQQMMSKNIDKVKLDFKGIFSENYQLTKLKRINVPALALYGKGSPIVSQALSKKIISHLTLVESEQINAGHMAPLSHPELVEPLIEQFIRSI